MTHDEAIDALTRSVPPVGSTTAERSLDELRFAEASEGVRERLEREGLTD